jgi:hypothetical protein
VLIVFFEPGGCIDVVASPAAGDLTDFGVNRAKRRGGAINNILGGSSGNRGFQHELARLL